MFSSHNGDSIQNKNSHLNRRTALVKIKHSKQREIYKWMILNTLFNHDFFVYYLAEWGEIKEKYFICWSIIKPHPNLHSWDTCLGPKGVPWTEVPLYLISHFRIPPRLCIKTRLSAQPLIWKWFFILMQIKLLSTRKIVHLASFWKWGFLELGSGVLNERHTA